MRSISSTGRQGVEKIARNWRRRNSDDQRFRALPPYTYALVHSIHCVGAGILIAGQKRCFERGPPDTRGSCVCGIEGRIRVQEGWFSVTGCEASAKTKELIVKGVDSHSDQAIMALLDKAGAIETLVEEKDIPLLNR